MEYKRYKELGGVCDEDKFVKNNSISIAFLTKLKSLFNIVSGEEIGEVILTDHFFKAETDGDVTSIKAGSYTETRDIQRSKEYLIAKQVMILSRKRVIKL